MDPFLVLLGTSSTIFGVWVPLVIGWVGADWAVNCDADGIEQYGASTRHG